MSDKPITRREILISTALIGAVLAGLGLGRVWYDFREKIGKSITRKEFFIITGGGLAAIYSTLGWLFREEIEDTAFDTLDRIVDIPTFDPFPPEFSYVGSNDHCYVIVHPGYSSKRPPPTKEFESYPDNLPQIIKKLIEYLREDYGSYKDYLQNTKKLNGYLRDSKELTLSAIRTTKFYNGKYEDGLSPPTSALTIITKSSSGKIKRYVKTPHGKRKQEINKIYSFLEEEGITDVWFAGEWAWYKKYACLGTVAKGFHERGFNIKGVEGCIYPTTPPKKSNEVLEKLYSDMVKLPFLRPMQETSIELKPNPSQ